MVHLRIAEAGIWAMAAAAAVGAKNHPHPLCIGVVDGAVRVQVRLVPLGDGAIVRMGADRTK
jgi:hypothetical protein